jgi:hypothetical protein
MFNRRPFGLEIAAGCASPAIFLVKLIRPHWLESLFDETPDSGDGSLESAVAIFASLFAMVLFARTGEVAMAPKGCRRA